jgi:hypothetical protein
MYVTQEELERELALVEAEFQGAPLKLSNEAKDRVLAWVRSLPAPPTTVMHPSEYWCRGPKYLEGRKILELQSGEFTVEDLRKKKANGAPIRILDPENRLENGARAPGT